MKVGTNDLFTEPWNTIAGSNWIWDTSVHARHDAGQRYSSPSGGIMADPVHRPGLAAAH